MTHPTERVVIPVTGMTCAACQSRVQRTLSRVPGVADASVNLLLGNADVAFDPTETSVEQLVDAVRETGYGADLPTPRRSAIEDQGALDDAQEAEFADLRRKAIGSAVIGAVVMVVSMSRMGMGGSSVLAYGQLVATVVVMAWAGRSFYQRAWAAFRHRAADMNTLVAVGTGAAFVYSLIATLAPSCSPSRGVAPDVYYEAVIIIIALVLTGRAFEARAKRRTSAALRALAQLQPETARVVRGDATETDIPIDDVRRGDIVLVRPGERASGGRRRRVRPKRGQ